jgi:hypothetical protein
VSPNLMKFMIQISSSTPWSRVLAHQPNQTSSHPSAKPNFFSHISQTKVLLTHQPNQTSFVHLPNKFFAPMSQTKLLLTHQPNQTILTHQPN